MELRPLGTTGLQVSAVGLGTVKFGRNVQVKYPRRFDLPGDDALRRLLADAAGLGVNLLDTAPAYGSSEERIGALLEGTRARWIIATKVGEEFDGMVSRFDFSAAAVRRSVERSLRRLRTDWLDLVLVHSDGEEESFRRFAPAIETLQALRRAGAIRATGFSGKTLAGALMAVEHCDAVMLTFNPGYKAEQPAIAAAHRQHKGVLVKKGLASGRLAGLSGEESLQTAMDCIFAEPGVSSLVVGTLDPAHLAADVAAADSAIRRAARAA